MKKIGLLVFFATFQLFVSNCKAQLKDDPSTAKERYAGYQLMVASRHYYTGVILMGAGTTLYVIGATAKPTATASSSVLVLIGALAFITGTVFTIESYSHIGKAGRMLSGPAKLSLGTTNSGVGLTYCF
jgi:hypothetical protein